jgi:ribosome modulation factor
MIEQSLKAIAIIIFSIWFFRFLFKLLYAHSPGKIYALGKDAYWMNIPATANPYSGIFGSWWLNGWIAAYKRHIPNHKGIIKSRGQEAYFQEIPLELNPYYGDEGWYWFDGWIEGRKKAAKSPSLRNPDSVF